MGGKSGGGSATNNQMVQMQMQQAAQAQAANFARNIRLQSGVSEINDIFQGAPQGSTKVDFSNITQGMTPTGTESATTGWGMTSPNMPAGYGISLMPDDGSGVPQYMLTGPGGTVLNASQNLQDLANTTYYAGGDPNNRTDPFAPLYTKLYNAVTGYYMPQEDQQFQDAKSSLSYNLARAGSFNSSIAHTDQDKLANQDSINQAQIAANAENQVGAFRTTVQQDQQSALNQLYSTEDPSVAADTAGNMVANAQLTKPMLNPVGALFTPIEAGVGTALTGFTNPYAYINSSAAGVGNTGVAGTPNANTGYGANQ